jgi:hypothetical protein
MGWRHHQAPSAAPRNRIEGPGIDHLAGHLQRFRLTLAAEPPAHDKQRELMVVIDAAARHMGVRLVLGQIPETGTDQAAPPPL